MTNKFILYKQVIIDYFKDFSRDLHAKKNSLIVCLVYLSTAFLYTCAYGLTKEIEQLNKNWLVGIPIFIAVISSSFHRTSLPFMMYLIPYSKKQREEYIQKMLAVKIAFPLIFGCLFDIAAVCLGSVSYYAVILQMTGILFITYICGILCDGSFSFESQYMPVYGEIRTWSGLPPFLCYMGSNILFGICVEPVSQTEFWVILSIMLLFLLPMAAAIQKHWKTIRSNFADYEMTIKRTNVR